MYKCADYLLDLVERMNGEKSLCFETMEESWEEGGDDRAKNCPTFLWVIGQKVPNTA